jgi:two-component system NtrC family sensor kinase
MAQGEVERLIKIVQRMLDFYRPSRGGVEPADVNQIVERVLSLIQKRLEHGDIDVHTELADDLPVVPIVSDQISQVILNLLINAIEAMPTGGRLWLKTELSEEEDDVLVTVRDSGPGMSAEQVNRLFEPFYTTKPGGTGLGMAISYGIIERHGGAIDVLSEPGRGTTFVVALPVKRVSRVDREEGA